MSRRIELVRDPELRKTIESKDDKNPIVERVKLNSQDLEQGGGTLSTITITITLARACVKG